MKKNIKTYLLENTDILKMVVDEINSYNGSLDYLQVYENEEYIINELFSNPYEALKSCFYGCYNFYDSLIRFDSYGNIETLTEYEYEIELKENIDEIIEELFKIYNKIDIINELYELIEKVEV